MNCIRARVAVPFVVAALVALTLAPARADGDTERVTGGGWITPTYPAPPPPSGEEQSVFAAAAANPKCTFGFVASCTQTATGSEYDGELTFQDHKEGMKLKSLLVTGLSFPDATTAVFTGTCEVRTSS